MDRELKEHFLSGRGGGKAMKRTYRDCDRDVSSGSADRPEDNRHRQPAAHTAVSDGPRGTDVNSGSG